MASHQQKTKSAGEHGYVLLVFALFSALLVIGIYRILPKYVFEGQRTKEEELIFRGQQYRRGIQLFVRKFGRYPNSLDELENTNQVRYIRKLYPDPMTAEGEWRLVHIGPDGTFYDSGNLAKPPDSSSSTSTTQGDKTPDPFNLGGEKTPATSPNAGAGTTPNAQQPRAGGIGSSIVPPGSGQTFGGGGIAGVASMNEGEAIKVVAGHTYYNEWEFVYDYRTDPLGKAAVDRVNGVQPQAPQGQPPQRPGGPPPSGRQPTGWNPITGQPIGGPPTGTPPGAGQPPLPGVGSPRRPF